MSTNGKFRPGQSGNPTKHVHQGNPHRWQPGQSGTVVFDGSNGVKLHCCRLFLDPSYSRGMAKLLGEDHAKEYGITLVHGRTASLRALKIPFQPNFNRSFSRLAAIRTTRTISSTGIHLERQRTRANRTLSGARKMSTTALKAGPSGKAKTKCKPGNPHRPPPGQSGNPAIASHGRCCSAWFPRLSRSMSVRD